MANYTEKQIEQAWNRAKAIDNYDKDQYRQDVCGAWIEFSKYGEQTDYGWEIDHKNPVSNGGSDNIANLRAMQWENNRSKSDDYPSYTAVITSDGNKNVRKEQRFKIS